MSRKKKTVAPMPAPDLGPDPGPPPSNLHPVLLPDPLPITQSVYPARDL